MKKIAFVLYAKQLLSITYLGGLPNTSALEKELHEALDDTYEITFKWEEAVENRAVDALIIPDPFPPMVNDENILEIKIPAQLLLNKKIAEVKEIIDGYFK
ncbi:hypothetical protein [uncultured Enterococcus sp.]|uniref:hypothetical protein n=1 Tax=uncultured Enterococcus sp. TaxID=167972 RepID=UPI002AA74D05|nr:hypothetical protein [uncultured Enterococcus sp.]